jgi:hypothetical protein
VIDLKDSEKLESVTNGIVYVRDDNQWTEKGVRRRFLIDEDKIAENEK